MRLPSAKTIQTAFPDLSPDAVARVRWEMRNGPDIRVLRDIAETLQTYGFGYGVESIQHGHNVKSPAIAYVNMGDPTSQQSCSSTPVSVRITWSDAGVIMLSVAITTEEKQHGRTSYRI